MFTTIFFVGFLPSILLAKDSHTDIVDAARPRYLTVDQFNARMTQYWTPERLKGAQLMNRQFSNTSKGNSAQSLFQDITAPTGPQSSVPGSMPSGNGTGTGSAFSSAGRQVYTTGRVFWSVGNAGYSCSASVVVSATGDLISTAGHCVFDTATNAWLISSKWVFVPAYHNGNSPFGVWPARRVLGFQAYINSGDYNYDVAFVALSTVNGQHIQARVGAQGIGFNFPRLAFTYALGYPVNLYDGQYLQLCSGNAQESQWIQNNYIGQGLPCIMGGGCSGGPWMQSVTDATGLGFVTSVNSFTISNVPNVMNGPYFGSDVQTLYDSAKIM